METTYAMAGLQLLGLLRDTLAGCARWQVCEGALYLARCISTALRSRAVGSAREGQCRHAEQQDSAAFIQMMFQVGVGRSAWCLVPGAWWPPQSCAEACCSGAVHVGIAAVGPCTWAVLARVVSGLLPRCCCLCRTRLLHVMR
jgi:hypothetical protein